MSTPYQDLPILVVDDARISAEVVRTTLQSAGYSNIRYADNSKDALVMLEDEPATLILADWVMPDMDGLELSRRVRLLDELHNRYSYIILLTAKESVADYSRAFNADVDDLINKGRVREQLLPRVLAGERLAISLNRLMEDNDRLLQANQELEEGCFVDSLTGLGNQQYAVNYLDQATCHAGSRGGAVCYILCGIMNFELLKLRLGQEAIEELLIMLGRRLRQLVRPLDSLSRVQENRFAIITHQPDIALCHGGSFRRIQEGVNNAAYRTAVGHISINVAFSLCAADINTGLPEAEQIMSTAEKQLRVAEDSGDFMVWHWERGKEPV